MVTDVAVLDAFSSTLFWVLLPDCRLQGLAILCSRILCIPRATIVEEAQNMFVEPHIGQYLILSTILLILFFPSIDFL
jgi:hypothetical protein